ncbi:MAG: hypothetical protein ABJE47_19225 [bacterium]
MFDAEYFRTTLPRDVEAMGGSPIVEVHLVSGQSHRVRSVTDVGIGVVTLEAYLGKGDLAHHKPRFGASGADAEAHDVFRAVVSYDSVAAVILDPSVSSERARTGFASPGFVAQ